MMRETEAYLFPWESSFLSVCQYLASAAVHHHDGDDDDGGDGDVDARSLENTPSYSQEISNIDHKQFRNISVS